MKRDWDVVRGLLFRAEGSGIRYDVQYGSLVVDESFDGYHLRMMAEAKLIARNSEGILAVTIEGRELLDYIRNNRVWSECKAVISLNGGGLPTDLLISVARSTMVHAIGLPDPH